MNVIRYIYAFFAYLITGVSLVAFLLFFENVYLAQTVSLPTNAITLRAILIDVGLLLIFGLQHSIMAREGFKNWLKTYLPPSIERITYILASSLILIIVVLFWQPFGTLIWDVRALAFQWILRIIGLFGGGIIAISVQQMNSRYFMGWQQLHAQNAEDGKTFATPFFYQYVRHPIYFGTLLAIWFVPVMSVSGILFCIGMTLYIIIGATYEERDLKRQFGKQYENYQKKVGMLFPFLK